MLSCCPVGGVAIIRYLYRHEKAAKSYTALSLLGFHIRCEVATGEGYADAVIETDTHVYVMEFKVGHSPQEALAQVRERRYAKAHQADEREVLLVGVSFSTEFKGVAEWEVEEV